MPYTVPLDELTAGPDRMPAILARFRADQGSVDRLNTSPLSARRRQRVADFLNTWRQAIDDLPFEDLTREDQADWILFRNLLEREGCRLAREAAQFAEMEPIIPFAPDLARLEDERRDLLDVDPQAIAGRLDRVAAEVGRLQAEVEGAESLAGTRPSAANRAAGALDGLLKTLEGWFTFYQGYDPAFTWWAEKPYRSLEQALKDYAVVLRERLAGAADPSVIVGDPIGRDALMQELAAAFIPYTPEELIEIGAREEAWCRTELLRASREMGCGDDWRQALETVKGLHQPPGGQTALVRDLAREAIAYVEERDLVTIPPLAREGWRMEMMTPEAQKVNPFFLGGETIIVSYPTNTMDHAQKLMSLRGNNRHFSRATVQHELIPGHYLQGFSQERWRPYRRLFYTPFWTEGWTLHWEMLLWDLGFPASPEDRVGMLFWRLHRCARVLFSLRFHLGEMTAQECVDLLVDEYGHERDNASAEVRRSLKGDYDALYQCAYLLGGLQVRALHRELTGSGPMTNRQFHDAFLHENCMPIAVVRALLRGLSLGRDFRADWRFYEAGREP